MSAVISLPKKGDGSVKNDRREMDDMTQLLEIINTKGDEGELREIVCNDELFWKSLRAQAEDSAKGGGEMELLRAKRIAEAGEIVPVMYKGKQVVIQHVDDEREMVRVYFTDESEHEQDVPVRLLEEQ